LSFYDGTIQSVHLTIDYDAIVESMALLLSTRNSGCGHKVQCTVLQEQTDDRREAPRIVHRHKGKPSNVLIPEAADAMAVRPAQPQQSPPSSVFEIRQPGTLFDCCLNIIVRSAIKAVRNTVRDLLRYGLRRRYMRRFEKSQTRSHHVHRRPSLTSVFALKEPPRDTKMRGLICISRSALKHYLIQE
jgi:hypothetical protein